MSPIVNEESLESLDLATREVNLRIAVNDYTRAKEALKRAEQDESEAADALMKALKAMPNRRYVVGGSMHFGEKMLITKCTNIDSFTIEKVCIV